MKTIQFFSVLFLIGFTLSCTTVNKSMREPNVLVELDRDDFELSEQVMGAAATTQILGIDFKRLFNKESGTVDGFDLIDLANIPVIGNVITDRTANYALYEVMKNNEGYDVVFYPQYHTTVDKPFIGLGFIYKKTTVQVKARLGKLK